MEDGGENVGGRPAGEVEVVGLATVDQDAGGGVEEDGGARLLGEVRAGGRQAGGVGEPGVAPLPSGMEGRVRGA